jgi:cyanuric acid amidohydrolase
MPLEARVHRISAAGPDDVSGIEAIINAGRLDPTGIIGIFGKTEGNGCVNDFSRGYALQSLGLMLRRHMPEDAAAAVCLVMSGGTEGGMAPHFTVFERREGSGPAGPALAIGRAHTPALLAEQLGRMGQVHMVAAAVAKALADARIGDPNDIHFVQVKCPLLTLQRVMDAQARGASVATHDTLKSMGLSRAASALGVAVALGEIDASALSDEAICTNWDLWSGYASCSAGIELTGHEIVVFGMSKEWVGPLAIDHAVMRDAIDVEPVRAALAQLGIEAAGQLSGDQHKRLIAMFAKAEASHDGRLRGYRHTMLDDSDISATRHARAFVCGALAGLVGHAEIYVSGGAEHQGPDGGGPVAVIAERNDV